MIVADKFNDFDLLEKKLLELKVSEVVTPTQNGYELLERYASKYPNVSIKFVQLHGRTLMNTYESINHSDTVVIITNGDGYRTPHAIANAVNENKQLIQVAYESSALSLTAENNYLKIGLTGALQKGNSFNGIYLKKEEVERLIQNLTEALSILE